MSIQGTCAPQFAEVRTEFERNFAERGEVGASVHITLDGEPVVDLWGGQADPLTGQPWSEETIVHVWSCTKAATSLCAHILASRGELDLNAPVTHYWPEYGAEGKDTTLVRHLLSHQAGLPAATSLLPANAFYDWDLITSTLAAQKPLWQPGTRHGYHGLTFGFLIGEVIRRATGLSLGQFFEKEVSGPLALDFWMGLPDDLEPHVAPTIPVDPTEPGLLLPSLFITAMTQPESLPGLMLLNNGGYMAPGESDSRAAHTAEMGAIGGISNARGLAGMYRPLALGGTYNGIRLVEESQIPQMSITAVSGQDAVVGVPSRFSLGFQKQVNNTHLPANDAEGLLMPEEAFGHTGMGGSLGFADPKARISFGYTMNKQGPGLALNSRGQSLVNALYRALGYHQSSNTWYA
ncbi:serine hydrolase domain-containing protein [Lentzea sp. BCCO 10_0856]|uniref:Serine hydrolase domain-containing protein n=1 Tax=Lentzea miocenica TaxID=3095431 RepID=A0ABU4T874_9PSEU|nr:serine hydrolase domain-containing protein [Lentzea sp. BCCO 10_0856]MDX8034367.1 serine hydrolase domain-containing protein [Lentzea sp. BCCO 10_0856]